MIAGCLVAKTLDGEFNRCCVGRTIDKGVTCVIWDDGEL